MSSNCCACGKGNGFEDHGWLNISPTTIFPLVQITSDGKEEVVPEPKWFICQSCSRLATAAWARECRRKDVIKNPPPSPTNSPAGAGTAYVEELKAVAA